MDRNRIAMLINFDGEDTSTGYISAGGASYAPELYLEKHIADICGEYHVDMDVPGIPEIRDNMVCFYEAYCIGLFNASELLKFLKRFPYLTIGLDIQDNFRTVMGETPEDIVEVCKRTRWFDHGVECSIKDSQIYREADTYADGEGYWQVVYDGLSENI